MNIKQKKKKWIVTYIIFLVLIPIYFIFYFIHPFYTPIKNSIIGYNKIKNKIIYNISQKLYQTYKSQVINNLGDYNIPIYVYYNG